MTVSLKDRVKQTTSTTGIGTITLLSTPVGYQSFSSVYNDGDEVYYVIENKSNYEIGVGTYNAGTLSRDTVLKSTNANAKLSLVGRSTVFVSIPAQKSIYLDGSNKASIDLGKLSNVTLTTPASGQGILFNGTNWVNGNLVGYTDEQAQDAVGNILVGSTGINIVYNDPAPSITITATGLQPLDDDLTSLAAATGTNTIYYRSASNTWSPVVIGTGISFTGGTLSNTLDLSNYIVNTGSYSNPSWLTSLAWSKITGTPTTISGYGITDAYTKTEVDTFVTGLLDLKGSIDCSTNPNYPSALKGDAYVVSVAGKIGGASGTSVDIGDTIIAYADNVGGTQAGVGTSWFVLEHNLNGALIASNNLSDVANAATALSNLGGLSSSTATATYVPYSGATGSVNLGSNSLTAGAATFSGDLRCATGTNGLYFCTTGNTAGRVSMFGNDFYIDNATSSGVINFRTGIAIQQPLQINTTGLTGSNDVLSVVRSTAAQTIKLFGTYTSSTSQEYLKFRGVASSNFEIGPANGSAGGTLRGLTIGGYTNDSSTITPWLTFTNTGAATFVDNVTMSGSKLINDPSSSNFGFGHFYAVGTPFYARTASGYTMSMSNIALAGFVIREGYSLGWGDWAGGLDGYPKTAFTNPSTNVVVQRNVTTPTSAQTFAIANTWTSSTNYEYGTFQWQSNQFRIGSSVGSVGGNPQSTVIGSWNGAGSWTPAATFATTGTTTLANTLYTSSFSYMVVGSEITFARDTANTITQRNGVNGQTAEWCNTYTSATNLELGRMQWTSNEWRIGTAVGSLGGTQRLTVLGGWDSTGTFTHMMNINSSQNCVQIGVQDTTYYRALLQVATNDTSTAIGNASISKQGIYIGNTTNTVNRPVGVMFGGQPGWAHGGIFGIMTNAGGNTAGDIAIAMRVSSGSAGNFSSVARWYGPTGKVVFSGGPDTSGMGNTTDTQFTVTVPNHVNQITTVESPDVLFTLGSKTWAAGNITTQRFFQITQPTANFATASTITTATTLSIAGAPVAGTNATITNPYTFNVESGASLFNGAVIVNQPSAATIAQSWVAAASPTANTLEVRSSSGNIIFYVGADGGVCANRNVSANGYFAASETAAGYSFQGGWGGLRANSATPTNGNLLNSPYAWELRCGAGYGVHILNGTNAQFVDIYNTYTSTTNLEKGRFLWTSNEFRIGTAVGSAGGTQRGLSLGTWNAAGTFTNLLYLSPTTGGVSIYNGSASGTGSFCGAVHSGTANVSGQYAVAFGSSYFTVSGTRSFLIAGDFTTVSGTACFAHGYLPGFGGPTVAGTGNFCTAGGAAASTANWGFAHGQSAETRLYGQIAHAAGRFSALADAQATKFILRIKTTNATATTMMLDGSTTRLTIPSGKMMFADIWLSGIKSDGSAAATYRRKAAIKNVGGTTSLIGSVETIGTDYEDNVLTDVAITADDTNDALQINVTGIAAETWRWVAVIDGVELAYGT